MQVVAPFFSSSVYNPSVWDVSNGPVTQGELALYAPLSNPTFSGTVSAPNISCGTLTCTNQIIEDSPTNITSSTTIYSSNFVSWYDCFNTTVTTVISISNPTLFPQGSMMTFVNRGNTTTPGPIELVSDGFDYTAGTAIVYPNTTLYLQQGYSVTIIRNVNSWVCTFASTNVLGLNLANGVTANIGSSGTTSTLNVYGNQTVAGTSQFSNGPQINPTMTLSTNGANLGTGTFGGYVLFNGGTLYHKKIIISCNALLSTSAAPGTSSTYSWSLLGITFTNPPTTTYNGNAAFMASPPVFYTGYVGISYTSAAAYTGYIIVEGI